MPSARWSRNACLVSLTVLRLAIHEVPKALPAKRHAVELRAPGAALAAALADHLADWLRSESLGRLSCTPRGSHLPAFLMSSEAGFEALPGTSFTMFSLS